MLLSLTDPAVQDDFRQHLEEKVSSSAVYELDEGLRTFPIPIYQVKRYQVQFPDELAIVLSSPGHEAQKDQLDLILLEFRKLREGIIASGRKDAFAIEVYETSAKLALLGRNAPQIATILPHLVRVLHWPSQLIRAASSDLEGQMAKLRVNGDVTHLPVTPLNTRARFAAYYLLHTLLASRDRAAFSRLLGDLVDFEPSSEDARVPYTNPHIQLVLRLFRLDMTGNYAGISKILSEPRNYDKFAWIIVRSSIASFREHAWAVLRASYMATSDRKWLARSLCLEQGDESELQIFLEGKAWKDNVEADGTVLLKRGKMGG